MAETYIRLIGLITCFHNVVFARTAARDGEQSETHKDRLLAENPTSWNLGKDFFGQKRKSAIREGTGDPAELV